MSAQAFAGVDARLSRYSYLVSLLPQQVMADLDLDVRLIRRRYSSYTPVPGDPAALRARRQRRRRRHRAGLRRPHRLRRRVRRVGAVLRADGRARRAASSRRCSSRCGPPATCAPWSATTSCGTPSPNGRWARSSRRRSPTTPCAASSPPTPSSARSPTCATADLRQNVCFLYHLIGGGTGDWDVPVGGMGAVTDALARAAAAAGADIRTGTRGRSASSPDGEVAWDGGSRPRLHGCWPACAPVVLNRLLERGRRRPGRRPRRRPRARSSRSTCCCRGCRGCGTPRPTPRAAFAGTFHINEGYQQLQDAYAAAAAGAVPRLPPCEIYCHSLSDRSILGPDLAGVGRADADAVRAAHAGPALPRGPRASMRDLALATPCASLNSVLAEPIAGRAAARRRRAALPRGARRRSSSSSDLGAARAATSSTARCSGPGPRAPRRSAPGASRRRTSGCCSPAPARAAAAACPAYPVTTRRRPFSAR